MKGISECVRRKSPAGCGIETAIYYLVPLISITLGSLVCFWLDYGNNLSAYFITDWTNTGMDYFNMLAAVSQGDPYANYANWPPMCFLILRFLFHFVPRGEGVDLSNGFAMRDYMPAALPYLVYVVACLLVIGFATMRLLRGSKPIVQCSMLAATILCGPMMFALERGNIILISFASLLVYLALYTSASKPVRYVAYVFLGMSVATKMYPAVFAFLILFTGNKKEFVSAALISLALSILPFFAFGGIGSIRNMIEGVFLSSSFDFGLGLNYSFQNLVRIAAAMFGCKVEAIPAYASAVPLALCAIMLLVSREEWTRVFSLGLMCVWVPAFSYTYSLIFLLPAVVMLVSSESAAACWKKISAFFLALVFALYALPVLPSVSLLLNEPKLPLAGGCVLGNAAILALAVVVLFHSGTTCRATNRSAKHRKIGS